MITWFISCYLPSYPKALVYMLQSTEYAVRPYLAWYWRTRNFKAVAHRRKLELTRPAKLLLLGLMFGIALQVLLGAVLLFVGWRENNGWLLAIGALVVLTYPVVWAHLVVVPLLLGRLFIIAPKQKRLIEQSEALFAKHPATKIAIAGSYGKTTMKELLLTVLSEGKRVAATPANKNVAISHAAFVRKLQGDEEVLIIEYGEGKPGDVAKFAATTHPDLGIITGLAPAHLDQYKTLQAAGEDIFSLAEALDDRQVYVSGESEALQPFIKPAHHVYSQLAVLNWKVSDITVDHHGLGFVMKRGKERMKLQSALLGRHQVAPLAMAAALARELGLTAAQVEAGVAKTAPFEHRMQPRNIGGALIIDDTYNGNIEGVRAGLRLLKELPARRKIYVTPGLVDQGQETKAVHTEMGRLIAKTAPDEVVLMANSVTQFIQGGLKEGDFKGHVTIEHDPLAYYTSLDQVTAAGDVMLLQNDWTDNYA